MNPNIKDRAVLFLEAKLPSVNPGLQAELANGNILVRDHKMYVNKAVLVGSSNIIEMIDPTLSKTIGNTSFEKGKTDDDTAMAITGIIARYAPAAASADVTNQPYSEMLCDYAGALRVPKEIQNSEVEILIGNVKIYEGRFGNLFVNGREGNFNGESKNYLNLKAPKFVKGGQEVQIRLRVPAGLTVTGTATQNHFLQIEFDGAATSVKL